MASQFWTAQTTNATTSAFDFDTELKTFALWGVFDGATVLVQVSTDGGDNWINVRQVQGPEVFNLQYQVVATNRVKARFKLVGAGASTSLNGVFGAVA